MNNNWFTTSGSNNNPFGDYTFEIKKKTYFVCVNCKSRYLLPEIRGTELIRLACSGCGGRLEEE